ncbi:XRE family transcriptional regulator [Streptococcus uberis]|uniref:XRE family transcriptional regulator n=1 Tax=Streptococcus uberis TaxID=1349 RepID=UPI003D6BFE4B
MNRLKQLREEKHLNTFELVESIRHIAPTMTAKDWIDYENNGLPNKRNDEFWQKVADWFEVDLGYLYGYSKIRNDKYVIDLQDLIHQNLELKKEINFLTDENQRLTNELYESNTILEEFRRMLHIDS